MKSYRFATREDVSLILDFIKELAAYEKMSDEVIASKEHLTQWIFDQKRAEVIFALDKNVEVGFALFFHNFSTFVGKGGIYLEDLYIKREYRSKGHGKNIFKILAKIAKERNCGRFEWSCLDWNEPSIQFYVSLGAKPMDGWTVYRLNESQINELAED